MVTWSFRSVHQTEKKDEKNEPSNNMEVKRFQCFDRTTLLYGKDFLYL